MVSKQAYRDAMARFAAAVHVVSTAGAAGSCGFTASAACSVTDDPPTLLVCLNRASNLHTTFQRNGVFCLNTLSAGQQQIAELFSQRGGLSMEQRFELPVWSPGAIGAPVLQGALVAFECRIIDVREVGTHWVIFGGVEDVTISSGTAALLYVHRGYRKLDW